MDLPDSEPIEKIKMKEINDTIGTFLQDSLKDFNFNRETKRLERTTGIKTDIIDWYSGKWKVENNNVVFLSFNGIIRHNYIDTVIEKLFDDKNLTAFSIYEDFKEELGDDDFTLYEIHTTDELKNTLNEALQFFQNSGVSFFNKFATDDDFYQYLCAAKNYNHEEDTTPASSIRKSIRRIMFCHLVNKEETLKEINEYNLKCLTIGAVSPDDSIREYNEKLKLLEEYYKK
jgi:hypothetical protein